MALDFISRIIHIYSRKLYKGVLVPDHHGLFILNTYFSCWVDFLFLWFLSSYFFCLVIILAFTHAMTRKMSGTWRSWCLNTRCPLATYTAILQGKNVIKEITAYSFITQHVITIIWRKVKKLCFNTKVSHSSYSSTWKFSRKLLKIYFCKKITSWTNSSSNKPITLMTALISAEPYCLFFTLRYCGCFNQREDSY